MLTHLALLQHLCNLKMKPKMNKWLHKNYAYNEITFKTGSALEMVIRSTKNCWSCYAAYSSL